MAESNVKEKKCGIITFHNGSNYGAALQTYALQEVINGIDGYNAVIINYKNRFIMQGLDKIRFGTTIRNLYYTLQDLINYKYNKVKINRFKNFFQNYYCTTELYDKKELLTVDQNFDIVIAGSDQIWNPLLNKGLDGIYFGEIKGTHKRCSYASSLGKYQLDNHKYNKEMKEYLLKFDKVSVRENAEMLNAKLGINARDMCDPTLLLSREDWKNKFELEEIKDKYLLIYALSDFDHVISVAKKIGKKKKLRIVFIGMPYLFKVDKDIHYIRDAGPRQFVELFYNATFVVTNSFHGTAFSVNMHIPFVSILHKSSPERAISFLKGVGLEKQLIKHECELDEYVDMDMELFKNADKKLEVLRAIAQSFIKEF